MSNDGGIALLWEHDTSFAPENTQICWTLQCYPYFDSHIPFILIITSPRIECFTRLEFKFILLSLKC